MLFVFKALAQLDSRHLLSFMVLFSPASCVPARARVRACVVIGRPLTNPAKWLEAEWLKTIHHNSGKTEESRKKKKSE